jgi:predicted phage tail component-like protein
MLFTDAITWNGEHSYYDYGLTIRKPSGDMPSLQHNEVRVPYQQGSYIFSFVYDKRGTYSRRKIQIVFNIEGDNPTEIYRKRTEVIKWLMSNQGGELRFDTIPDAYFKDVYVSIPEYDNTQGWELATLTVEFLCYPFMISDYTRPKYYTAQNNFVAETYISMLSDVHPMFTCSSQCMIKYKSVTYTIPANSKRYQVREITFKHGTNNFELRGSGEFMIECFEEVL